MKKHMQKYISWGATILVTSALAMILFFCIFKFKGLAAGIGNLISILMPVIVGIAIAYVLSSPYDWLRHKILRLLARTFHWRNRKAVRCASILAMLGVFLGALAIIVGLLALVVPQLINSIAGLITNLPSNMMNLSNTIQSLVVQYYPDGEEAVMSGYAQVVNYIEEFVQDFFTPSVDTLNVVSTGVMNTVSALKNFFIGIIIAIYLLAGKEGFIRQLVRCTYAIFGKRWGNVIMDYSRFANQAFTGFITGTLLDAFFVFLTCMIVLNIIGMPYAVLVSVVVGVTNIIPFFGPFLGAIPSFIIIFIADPLMSLIFLVFILVLQQIDGNIINPKLVGNTIGIPSFWVLFAILLFGGLFGFVGMILGVPIFAVILHILEDIVNRLLRKKHLPVESENYAWLESIDADGKPVHLPARAELHRHMAQAEETAENPENLEGIPEDLVDDIMAGTDDASAPDTDDDSHTEE